MTSLSVTNESPIIIGTTKNKEGLLVSLKKESTSFDIFVREWRLHPLTLGPYNTKDELVNEVLPVLDLAGIRIFGSGKRIATKIDHKKIMVSGNLVNEFLNLVKESKETETQGWD